jgi:acyl-CoA reductase-like NAD-dependent aldehyde dehydrogenase
MTEELFGPISSIVTLDGHDAAIRQICGRLQPPSVYVLDSDDVSPDSYTVQTSAGR